MPTNFPSSADSFTNPSSSDSMATVSHAGQHTDINDAVEAIETALLDGAPLHIDDANERVGIGTSTPTVDLEVAGTVKAGDLVGDVTANSVSTTNLTVDTDTIYVDSSINAVGIGTTTPSATLDVDGIAQAERTVLDRNGVADGFPSIDVQYPGAASGYNLVLRAYNDTNPTGIMFVNGTTRTADGGASTMTIRNDNGASRFGNASYATTIEGTSVTMPGKPAFKAYSTSGDYTSGVLPYPNVVYNIGNHYNSSLSRFVAPVAGVYHFHAQVYRRLASSDDEVAMRVNASDVTRSRTRTVGAAGYANNHITELLYLNSGDYVDVDVALNGAHLNSGLFSFQGHLVG